MRRCCRSLVRLLVGLRLLVTEAAVVRISDDAMRELGLARATLKRESRWWRRIWFSEAVWCRVCTHITLLAAKVDKPGAAMSAELLAEIARCRALVEVETKTYWRHLGWLP